MSTSSRTSGSSSSLSIYESLDETQGQVEVEETGVSVGGNEVNAIRDQIKEGTSQ